VGGPSLIIVGDATPAQMVRSLAIDLADFQRLRLELEARGFPRPDPTTGNYDMDAVHAWRRFRNPHLFGLTPVPGARNSEDVFGERLEALGGKTSCTRRARLGN
jgi:hypothetical protein